MREIDKRLSEKIAVGSFIATLLVVLIHTPHNFDTVDWPAPFEYLIVEGFARIAVPYFLSYPVIFYVVV